MEPFRVLIDRIVLNLEKDIDFRVQILDIFNKQVLINGKRQFLENAISIYCKSLFDCLNKEGDGEILFYEL